MSDENAEMGAAQPASFWEAKPWRRWLGVLAGVLMLAFGAAAFLAPMSLQIAIVQFFIPPYSYTCLGLAVIALIDLRESKSRRIMMLLVLGALALLSLFAFAAGGVPPLLILATHLGFLIGWIAWPRRAGWTILWLVEALAWIGVAIVQGRFP